MFFAGDEFCNTQYGNNNAYCQDNPISWLIKTIVERKIDWEEKIVDLPNRHLKQDRQDLLYLQANDSIS